jgi:hypothetical protein
MKTGCDDGAIRGKKMARKEIYIATINSLTCHGRLDDSDSGSSSGDVRRVTSSKAGLTIFKVIIIK